MNYFVTSDYHLGHGDILKFIPRPFRDVDDMNEKIIQAHNSRVKPNDIVFHIGDFCFKGRGNSGMHVKALEWENRLNGKIIFIKGNHDANNTVKTIITHLTVRFGGYDIFMVHDPSECNQDYLINLVGHVHTNWHIKKNGKTIMFNVGIDVNKYMPLTLNEVIHKIEQFKKEKKIL